MNTYFVLANWESDTGPGEKILVIKAVSESAATKLAEGIARMAEFPFMFTVSAIFEFEEE